MTQQDVSAQANCVTASPTVTIAPTTGDFSIGVGIIDDGTSTGVQGLSFNSTYVASEMMDPLMGGCINAVNEQTTVYLWADDGTGNFVSCSVIVNLDDVDEPVITCLDDGAGGPVEVFLDANGEIDSLELYAAVATDNCNLNNFEATGTDTSPTGTFTGPTTLDCSTFTGCDPTFHVRLVADDKAGNTAVPVVCPIIVRDTFPPTAMCVSSFDVNLDASGSYTVTVADLNNGSSDNCGIMSITLSGTTTFTCADIGVTPIPTVDLVVTDDCGNTDVCTTTINVYDGTAPVINCGMSGTQTVNLTNTDPIIDLGNINNISTFLTNISFSDNCTPSGSLTGLTAIASPSSLDCDDIAMSPVPVTVTVTDAAGISSSCTIDVTVVDNVIPEAHCFDEIDIFLDANGDYTLMPSEVDSASIDGCGTFTMTVSPNTFNCTLIGTPQDVTLTVTDGTSSDDCTTVVNVLDNTPPVLVCKDTTFGTSLNMSTPPVLTVGDATSQSFDNCNVITFEEIVPNTIDCSNVGQMITANIKVRDASGNESTCQSTITVIDDVDPMVTCKMSGDVTAYFDAFGVINVNAFDLVAGFSDDCSAVTLSTSPSVISCDDKPHYIVTAPGDNNPSQLTWEIYDVTTTSPGVLVDQGTANTMGVSTIPLDPNNNYEIYFYDSFGDGWSCGDAVGTQIEDANGGVIWTYTTGDWVSSFGCGSSGGAYPSGTAVVDGFTFGPISLNQLLYPTVQLTATDNAGNTFSCSTDIMVLDTLPPTAAAFDYTATLDAMGMATVCVSNLDNNSSDNCAILDIFISKDSMSLGAGNTCLMLDCNDVTSTDVIWMIVVDECNNTDTTFSNITYDTAVPPSVTCLSSPPTVCLDAFTGMKKNNPLDFVSAFSSNCANTISISPTHFNCSHIGTQTVTLVVTDVFGGTASCQTQVLVEDKTPPTMTCSNHTINLNGNCGSVALAIADVVTNISDVCDPSPTVSINPTSFTCADLGNNTVEIIVEDLSGNKDTCYSTVQVLDVTPPTLTCADTICAALDMNTMPSSYTLANPIPSTLVPKMINFGTVGTPLPAGYQLGIAAFDVAAPACPTGETVTAAKMTFCTTTNGGSGTDIEFNYTDPFGNPGSVVVGNSGTSCGQTCVDVIISSGLTSVPGSSITNITAEAVGPVGGSGISGSCGSEQVSVEYTVYCLDKYFTSLPNDCCSDIAEMDFSFSSSFPLTYTCTDRPAFVLTIDGDDNTSATPSDLGWEIKDSNGNIVDSDSGVTSGVTSAPLDPTETYSITFTDLTGDGWSCIVGSSTYTNQVVDQNTGAVVWEYTPGDWVSTATSSCGDINPANFPNGSGSTFGPFTLGTPSTPVITMTVTDANGNAAASCDINVDVKNTPVAACLGKQTFYLDAITDEFVLTPADIDIGSSGTPCGTATMSVTPSLFTCSDVNDPNDPADINAVSLLVTNDIGVTATCNTHIIIKDNGSSQCTCVDYLTINGNPITNGTYEAGIDITSQGQITGATGVSDDVIIHADNSILLDIGFSIDANADVHIYIAPCDTQ